MPAARHDRAANLYRPDLIHEVSLLGASKGQAEGAVIELAELFAGTPDDVRWLGELEPALVPV